MNKQLQKRVEVFVKVLEEIPQLKYIGNSILRTKTKPIEALEGRKIGEQLGEILLLYRNITGVGRGLAAPQIGINKSVFVTYVDKRLEIFINPKIVKHSKTTNYYKELCISAGIMFADVKRSESVVMEWMGVNGALQRGEFKGLLARLYQHEESHLRGIVNLDLAREGGIEFVTSDPLEEKLRRTIY